MDLYNWKLKLSETEFFNNSIEKQNYLKDCLKNATQYYKANKCKIEPYAVKTIQLGNKETGFKTINLDNPPRPKITHKEVFENRYNEFVKEIEKEINKLNEYVEVEKEILKCEQRTSTQEKFFCYTKLNKTYLDHLQNSELLLKKANLKAYTEDINLYTPFVQKIESRLSELKQTNYKAPVSKITPNKPLKKISLNTNLSQSEIVKLHNDLKPYFVSTLEQWQNLFSEDITPFKTPIKVNRGVTIVMIGAIFKELEKRGIAEQWKSIIEKSKAFEKSNKIIKASSLTDALRKPRKGYQPNRKSIIKLNSIKDIMIEYIN